LAGGGFVFEYVCKIEINPREMGCFKWVLVDRVYYKLDFHIHQAKKKERVLDFVADGGETSLVFCANGVGPGGGVIDVAQQDIGIEGPRGGICFADFGVYIEDDRYARFGNMGEVVHAPLVGFVGLFTVDIDETRDVGEGGDRGRK